MKIGVIADTHIPFRAKHIPPKILEDFRSADMVIHAGDLGEASVMEQLKQVCKDVRAVWGNMDPDAVKKILPQKQLIKTSSYTIGVTHGYGHPDNLISMLNEFFKNDKVDVIIFGHSHQPLNVKARGRLYFNPGSATDTVFAPYNSYGIIEINDKIKARIIKI